MAIVEGTEEFWSQVIAYKWETYYQLSNQDQQTSNRIYDTFRQRFINIGVGEPIHQIRNVRNLGDGLFEIKHNSGVRVYVDTTGYRLGFSNKNNQQKVINKLKSFLEELKQ